jgi:uncharacterized protein (UPF0147 family)
MTISALDYDATFDNITTILDQIASDDETPRNVKRACLKGMEQIDIVRGHIRRSGIRERLDSMKLPRPHGVQAG